MPCECKPVLKCASCDRIAVSKIERWVADRVMIVVGACEEHWDGPRLIGDLMQSACSTVNNTVRDRNLLDL